MFHVKHRPARLRAGQRGREEGSQSLRREKTTAISHNGAIPEVPFAWKKSSVRASRGSGSQKCAWPPGSGSHSARASTMRGFAWSNNNGSALGFAPRTPAGRIAGSLRDRPNRGSCLLNSLHMSQRARSCEIGGSRPARPRITATGCGSEETEQFPSFEWPDSPGTARLGGPGALAAPDCFT